MSVDQKRDAGLEAWGHGGDVLGVGFDQDEAVPGGAVHLHVGLELAKEGLLELEDVEDEISGDQRASQGGEADEKDVFELVGAGRQDGGALVDLGGIEQVEDGEVLDGENLVHALDAEAALAVEEIGDMGLLESGLLGKSKAGKFS